MSLHKYRERLRIIDHHIRTKARGNAEVLAHKLNLSTIAVYKFLAEMREEGFPIKYSKKENRFYYDPPGKMIGYVFVEDKEDADNDVSEKTHGGSEGA